MPQFRSRFARACRVLTQRPFIACGAAALITACGNDANPAGASSDPDASSDNATAITFRSDVAPVTSVTDAKAGVFIPPFEDCRHPESREKGSGPDGKVCTNVAISGCTELGKYFPDYASCEVVRTQRPFWEEPPAKEPDPNDPRLQDVEYMQELAWVKEQIEACACVCCHDSRAFGGKAGQWDIARGSLWIDTLSDTGLALFSGLADSHVLGAYPAKQNHGFDRMVTGIPTTDIERMQTFMFAELERRGIRREQAQEVPPFGGPIYAQSVARPTKCKAGEGIAKNGEVRWPSGRARYVYVLAANSKNPGVPPNLDVPMGTLWRLDVLASREPMESGVMYGTTPRGTFQSIPERTSAPKLAKGQTYQLVVLADVGLPISNCLFEFGRAEAAAQPTDEQDADSASAGVDAGGVEEDASTRTRCTLAGADASGFGAPCSSDADCTCDADYCAKRPESDGYCSKRGCKENPSLCPSDWTCFDLTFVQAGSVCSRP